MEDWIDGLMKRWKYRLYEAWKEWINKLSVWSGPSFLTRSPSDHSSLTSSIRLVLLPFSSSPSDPSSFTSSPSGPSSFSSSPSDPSSFTSSPSGIFSFTSSPSGPLSFSSSPSGPSSFTSSSSGSFSYTGSPSGQTYIYFK